MKKEKIKLYHFTNENLANIEVKFFGENYFTSNDKKICNMSRSFFYIEQKPFEHRFKNCDFCYISEVKKSSIYDLRNDRKKLINRFSKNGLCDIADLLKYIKKFYLGCVYNTGNLNIVTLLYNIKPILKIKRRWKNEKKKQAI